MRDDLRAYVIDYLGDEASGVLIVGETDSLKQGSKSCGVGRQYTGTAGDTVNARVGVFLAYASEKDAGFIDRATYDGRPPSPSPSPFKQVARCGMPAPLGLTRICRTIRRGVTALLRLW